MDPLYLDKSNPDIYGTLSAAAKTLAQAAADAGLDRRLVELVNIRVSQLNGCAYCLDLHVRRAQELGETPQRLGVLAAWREAALYTDAERAALDIAEAVTVLPHPEERLDVEFRAREVLSDAEFAAVSWLAITMNAFNRVSITSRHPVKPRD